MKRIKVRISGQLCFKRYSSVYIPPNESSWNRLLKPYYVTTPIFYVNADPHIGHLHSMTMADILKRWHIFYNDRSSYMTTGTDEYGLKVFQASQKAGQDTRKFVDDRSIRFKQLAERAKLSYDRFIRTTDPDNEIAAKALWKLLDQNGYIYKGSHSGWYCISDETFYPESQVEPSGEVSPTGKSIMISRETGKAVEWTSEENYFFALSRLQEPLLEFYSQNRDFVVPQSKFLGIEREVREGLQDLSISRPTSRNTWGITLPGDDSQVMYVWFDALVNYLTSSGFPWRSSIEFQESVWPANVHVIGKDILRFHTCYWPAFLLAAGLPLPKQVMIHSHWTMGGNKMSKSLGNIADPFEMIDKFGSDSVRFFLANDGHLDHDSIFSEERIISRHDTELVHKYGNLVLRICGEKFNVQRAINSSLKDFQHLGPLFKNDHLWLIEKTNSIAEHVNKHMLNFQTSKALAEV